MHVYMGYPTKKASHSKTCDIKSPSPISMQSLVLLALPDKLNMTGF